MCAYMCHSLETNKFIVIVVIVIVCRLVYTHIYICFIDPPAWRVTHKYHTFGILCDNVAYIRTSCSDVCKDQSHSYWFLLIVTWKSSCEIGGQIIECVPQYITLSCLLERRINTARKNTVQSVHLSSISTSSIYVHWKCTFI